MSEMKRTSKLPAEWFKQADYDLGTAEAMLKAGRYIYAIFMCHLAVEKTLKGIYSGKLEKNPPKTHDLNYLCELIEIEIPKTFQDFIDNLNNLSVPTRYPDKLEVLLKDFREDLTRKTYNRTGELISWLKEETA